MKRIVKEINYVDTGLADDIVSGFELAGWVPESGVFPMRVKAPQLTVDQLRASAK